MPARPSNSSSGDVVDVGDVVVIPFDPPRAALAQVVQHYGGDTWYFAISGELWDERAVPDELAFSERDVALLVLSWDSLVAYGDWRVIGSATPVPVSLPTYQTYLEQSDGRAEGDYVVAADGSVLRPATAEDLLDLPRRQMPDPRRVERILRQFHGLEPWDPRHDVYRYRL